MHLIVRIYMHAGADDAIAAQGPRRDAAKDMVRSILAVPVEIYNALETASMNVVNDVADNTVDILRYRYVVFLCMI